MKRSIALLALLLWLSTVALVHAQTLPSVKPEQVGLSSERLGRLVSMLRNDSEKGQIPGAILLVARQGKIALFESVGVLDPKSKTPMTKDAIFRIYSMSKPITSVAIMTLVEDGKIALGDPVAKYIPQIAEMQVGVEKPGADGKPTLELVAPRRPMSLQDLLRHTSGLTYGIFGNTLVKKQYLDATCFDPRVPQRWQSGGGGMVGTVMDYARFCQMLLNGGTLDGKRILGPKTVAYMTADHLDGSVAPGPLYLPGVGFGFGLGFAVRREAGVANVQGSTGEFNWGGAGGP